MFWTVSTQLGKIRRHQAIDNELSTSESLPCSWGSLGTKLNCAVVFMTVDELVSHRYCTLPWKQCNVQCLLASNKPSTLRHTSYPLSHFVGSNLPGLYLLRPRWFHSFHQTKQTWLHGIFWKEKMEETKRFLEANLCNQKRAHNCP